jgi:hypothetical protein
VAFFFSTSYFTVVQRRFFRGSDYITSNERIICELVIGKDVDGNGHGLIEVQSRYLRGWTEKKHENLS